MGFQLVQNSVTLNGVMALILRYFIELGSFWAYYVKVTEDTRILSFCDGNVAQRM